MIRHYLFDCRNCGKPIALHAENTWQRFVAQGIPDTGPHSLAIACFHCSHVEIYSLDPHSPLSSSLRVVSRSPAIETECLGWLECEAAEHKFPAALFSVTTPAMSSEEKQTEIQSWNWDSLLCPSGHLMERIISKP